MEAMEAGNLASTLHVVEVSEWLDWLRRELTLGGISLPEEETAVLFIEHALRLADRAQGVYRHLPDSLRQRLISASIIYQCWGLQKRLRKEGRPRESGKLKVVAATSCLALLGTSGSAQQAELSTSNTMIGRHWRRISLPEPTGEFGRASRPNAGVRRSIAVSQPQQFLDQRPPLVSLKR